MIQPCSTISGEQESASRLKFIISKCPTNVIKASHVLNADKGQHDPVKAVLVLAKLTVSRGCVIVVGNSEVSS